MVLANKLPLGPLDEPTTQWPIPLLQSAMTCFSTLQATIRDPNRYWKPRPAQILTPDRQWHQHALSHLVIRTSPTIPSLLLEMTGRPISGESGRNQTLRLSSYTLEPGTTVSSMSRSIWMPVESKYWLIPNPHTSTSEKHPRLTISGPPAPP